MNTQDVIVLMSRMEAAWPNIFAKNRERETLYGNEFISCDYQKASSALNKLIGEQKMYPSISELRQALKSESALVRIENDCEECEGTGWIFTKDNFVTDCVCTPRSDEVKRSDKPNKQQSNNKMPASLDEAKAAFDRGLAGVETF